MKDIIDDLAFHYGVALRRHPGQRLLIVFDIDDTVLDMGGAMGRPHSASVDRTGAHRFEGAGGTKTTPWEEAVLSAHSPFRGIMELIRWFSLQPDTYVALVTGRPESSRADTVRALGVLAKEYSVPFADNLLFMKPLHPVQSVRESKIRGIQHFREEGFHVFAAVDSEPENLHAIAEAGEDTEILLLHTEAVRKSLKERTAGRPAGERLRPETPASGDPVSGPVNFIWDWTDMREETLFRFLSSRIQWIKVHSQFLFPDGSRGRLVSAHGAGDLDFYLNLIRKHRRRLNIELPEDDILLGRIMDLVSDYGFADSDLWFNGGPLRRGHDDPLRVFGILRQMYPSAIFQYPLGPADLRIGASLPVVKQSLEGLVHRGVDIFRLDWRIPQRAKILTQLRRWGFAVNVCNAHSLQSFLDAVLLSPSAITCPFNAPVPNRRNGSSPEPDDHTLFSFLVA